MTSRICSHPGEMALFAPSRDMDIGLCFQDLILFPSFGAVVVMIAVYRGLSASAKKANQPRTGSAACRGESSADGAESTDAAVEADPNVAASDMIESAKVFIPAVSLKFIFLIALITLSIVELFSFNPSTVLASDIVSTLILAITCLCMVGVHIVDLHVIRRSGSVTVFTSRSVIYSLLLLLLSLRYRSLWLASPTFATSTVGWISLVQLLLVLVTLIAELATITWQHHAWDSMMAHGLQTSPEMATNMLTRLLFIWVTPMLRLGNARAITLPDLWLLPPSMCTRSSRARMLAFLNRGQDKPQRTVMAGLWRWFGLGFAGAMSLQFASVGLDLLVPTLVGKIVQYVDEAARLDSPSLGYGLSLAFALLSVSVVSVLLRSQVFHVCMNMDMRGRSAVRGLLFDKLMRMSVHAQGENAGSIVQHVSVDTMNLTNMFFRLQTLPAIPLQLIISLVLLYAQLGPAVFAALGIVVVFSPLFAWTAKLSMRYSKTKLNFMDQRVKLSTDILQSIRTVKVNSWNDVFLDRVQDIRDLELGELRKSMVLSALNASMTIFVPALASFTALLLATISGRVITVDRLFVCLGLFAILQESINNLSRVMQPLMQTLASYQRIRSFLNLPERQPYVDRSLVVPAAGSSVPAISLKDAHLAWRPDLEATLVIESLDVFPGEHILVQGAVGAGKTCLMSAIVDQLHLAKGSVKVNGSIAYVSQEPWLMNASLRDNILFGLPMDEDRYAQAVHASALYADLTQFKDRDLVLIGERGITLSGGQKMRVALCRELYANRDIYLIDDALAALDAHVVRHVMTHAIEGMLKGKTIMSVTHQPNYFSLYDGVIEMEAGKIKSLTRREDLRTSDTTLTPHGDEGDASRPFEDSQPQPLSRQDAQQGNVELLPDIDGDVKTVRAFLAQSTGKPVAGIAEEKLVSGSVDMGVYSDYFRYCGRHGVFLQVVLLAAFQASNLGQQYWIGFWSSSGADAVTRLGYFFGIYGALVGLYAVLAIVTNVNASAVLGIRAARNMSRELFARILGYPMSFFDYTPLGRVINRLSSDQDAIDRTVPNLLNNLSNSLFSIAFALVAAAISSPWFLVLVVPIVAVLYLIARYYAQTSRQVMRIASITRSPMYSMFGELVNGRSVILARGSVDLFGRWLEKRLDSTSRVMYCNMSMSRWLSAWLQLLGSLIVFSSALLSVLLPTSSVLAGVGIVLAQSVTGMLMSTVRIYVWLENAIVAVERIREYNALPLESDADQPLVVTGGEVRIVGVSARYAVRAQPDVSVRCRQHDSDTPEPTCSLFERFGWRGRPARTSLEMSEVGFNAHMPMTTPYGPLVLNNLNITIPAGQSVAIVGRTGSGKSTTVSCLLKLLEPMHGKILIDGTDIGTVRLADLRSSLTIVSQDPCLFSGTLRFNLDPRGVHSDDRIWSILDSVSSALAAEVRAHPEQLEMAVQSSTLSLGQRQLVCMARALLRDTRIYVLDEASASIDLPSEAALQACLRSELMVNRTLIVVAHRIHTVLALDRILVLDKGSVIEDDAPLQLVRQQGSQFRSFVEDAGLLDAALKGEL